MDVRNMTMEQLFSALSFNIQCQQKWSRAMEQVLYFGKEAPPGYLEYGKNFIWEHQDRIEIIEIEIDRRKRVELFKTFYEEVCKKYEAHL